MSLLDDAELEEAAAALDGAFFVAIGILSLFG
jgi:hypothetical protein